MSSPMLPVILALRTSLAAAVDTGAPAPDFTLVDHHGAKRSLKEFAGKPVVIEWVNFDCPFVRKHYGNGSMQALQKSTTDQQVTWLSICSSASGKQGHLADPAAAAAAVTANKANPTALLLDPDGAVGKAYAAKTTPHCFVIDATGVIVYQGAIDSIASSDHADVAKATNHVRAALTAMLAGQPVALAQSKPYGCSVKYGK